METRQITGVLFSLMGLIVVGFWANYGGFGNGVNTAGAVSVPLPAPATEVPRAVPTTAPPVVVVPQEVAPPIESYDAAPEADSPEMTSEVAGACFSMYSRNLNVGQGACLAEWYPADYAPRAGDTYWCASNGGRVEWLPVRLYDGRSSLTVVPYGKPSGC